MGTVSNAEGEQLGQWPLQFSGFGGYIPQHEMSFTTVIYPLPADGCESLSLYERDQNKSMDESVLIVLQRGRCSFVQKVRKKWERD